MAGRRIDRDAAKKEVLAALSVGAYIKDACAAAGISADTLAIWEKRDSDFSERLSRAREKGWIASLAVIRRAALDGDWRAAGELLDRTGSPYRKSVDINLNIRARAERIAADLGLSVDDVLAEAELIVAGMPRS